MNADQRFFRVAVVVLVVLVLCVLGAGSAMAQDKQADKSLDKKAATQKSGTLPTVSKKKLKPGEIERTQPGKTQLAFTIGSLVAAIAAFKFL